MLSENSILSKRIVHYEYIIKMVQNTWSKKQQIHGCLEKKQQQQLMLIFKWPENNFSHFKSLRLLTMNLIKNMEFNNHSWHACYVPRTMPKN